MRTPAAVLVATDRPLELAELEPPPLGPGQALIEVAFSGVCHTQLLEARGRRGEDRFLPHCLGHEGSGTVVDVGPGVTKVRSGDRVILSWMKGSGSEAPSVKYDWHGRTVNAGAIATFSRFAVISENRLTALPDDIELIDAALLGCAVPTGLGAVFNSASARPGHTIAVFGVGGIGLCAVAGAVIAGCSKVIAIDLIPSKLKVAISLGATDVIHAGNTDIRAEITRLCPEGLDLAIEATGRPEVMVQALESVRPQGGATVVVGNATFGDRVSLDPALLNQGKRLLGTWGGDNQPDRDFPRYCRLLRSGQLRLAPLRSELYALSDINKALDDLEAGRVTRPLVDMSSR
jgi:S-(hydroxymethyl)glutathione dehydrogenase / alcohol dehydrogenase